MSFSITNRVILPDTTTLYISDDQYGDRRMEELYVEYGDATVEVCHKELGKNLDELTPFFRCTLGEYLAGEGGTLIDSQVGRGIW